MTKENLLKEVWATCSFDEIIDSGFEQNKCSGLQLIEAADDFRFKDNSYASTFLERLKELCKNTPKHDLPCGREVMEILTDYFYDTGLLNYYDNDDLIDHLYDSYELNNYIKNKCNEAVNDYIYQNENFIYTFKDFCNEIENMNEHNFKRFLCDIFKVNYYISNEELLKVINEKIK